MADKEFEAEEMIVVFTDDEGNEYKYQEEMIIPVGEEKFALLIGIHDEDEAPADDDDEDVIIAKIVVNADGEEEYIEPTDEEFDAVQKAYDKLMDEEEAKMNE